MIVKNRIKKHSEFQKIIAEGELKRTCSFTVYTLKNDLGYSRFGISVPKKTGTAVIRNKVKRQIRACIAMLSDYSKPIDYVLIVRKGYNTEAFNNVKKEIQEIL